VPQKIQFSSTLQHIITGDKIKFYAVTLLLLFYTEKKRNLNSICIFAIVCHINTVYSVSGDAAAAATSQR
jgi:hypothetical protein